MVLVLVNYINPGAVNDSCTIFNILYNYTDLNLGCNSQVNKLVSVVFGAWQAFISESPLYE